MANQCAIFPANESALSRTNEWKQQIQLKNLSPKKKRTAVYTWKFEKSSNNNYVESRLYETFPLPFTRHLPVLDRKRGGKKS